MQHSVNSVLEEAATHVANLNEHSLDDDDVERSQDDFGRSQDASLNRLLELALEHAGSTANALSTSDMPAEDPADAEAVNELVLRLRRHGSTDQHALESCLRDLDRLLDNSMAAGALRAAAEELVAVLPTIRDGTTLAAAFTSLERLVRTSDKCRELACTAGAEKHLRLAITTWHDRDDVCNSAHKLLCALAFERPDSPGHAEVLQVARTVDDDDDDSESILALTAAMERQAAIGRTHGHGPFLEAGPERSTCDMTLASCHVPLMIGEGCIAPITNSACTSIELTAMDESAHEHPGDGVTDLWAGGCVFSGPCCTGEQSHTMPWCEHVVVCAPCALALQVMAEELDTEARNPDCNLEGAAPADYGAVDGDGAAGSTHQDGPRPDRLRFRSLAWCPVCAR